MIEQFQRVADRAVRGRRSGGHLIARIEPTDGSWCWETVAIGADAAASPVRPSTPFHLASVTKMYTAALVLRLAAHGRLAVTEPISAHLPAQLTDRLHVLDGRDRTAAITIGHLLTHTSGLPDYCTEAPRGRSSLATRLSAGGDEAWTVADVADQVRQLRPHFAPQDLDARRVKVRYSDTNYQLLGAVVEATTGAPFAVALRSELLRPLGLQHTWIAGTDAAAQHPQPSPIRNRDGQLDLPLAFGSMGPDGGLIASATDAIGYLRALHAAPVSPLATMTAHWYRFSLPRDRAALLTPGWPIEYGLGIMRFRPPTPPERRTARPGADRPHRRNRLMGLSQPGSRPVPGRDLRQPPCRRRCLPHRPGSGPRLFQLRWSTGLRVRVAVPTSRLKEECSVRL